MTWCVQWIIGPAQGYRICVWGNLETHIPALYAGLFSQMCTAPWSVSHVNVLRPLQSQISGPLPWWSTGICPVAFVEIHIWKHFSYSQEKWSHGCSGAESLSQWFYNVRIY